MATEPSTNGSSATAGDGMSAAERLMQQHAADDEAHKVTIEDVPDEEFTLHPPPSGAASLPISNDPSRVATPSGEQGLSGKAAGKQPMRDEPQQAPAPKKPAIDTQSEDAFPALGGPKAQPAAAAPTPWSRKPAAVGKAANGMSNGMANGSAAPSNVSPRTSTPMSGIMTPSSTAPSQRGPTPQMTMPGRYSEQIQLHPSMMTPRNQLKKPVNDILRDINKRSKANVEMKAGPGGVVVFEGTGPVDAVRVALKEVATQLCSKQNLQVPVPASVRGKIVGKQGATIQAISKKTGARINISKQEAAEILEDDEMDTTVDVTIEGDPFAVQMARQDIERIVNEHTSSVNTRLKHIPPEYYPFLNAHPRTNALRESRDLKMQIPQYHTWEDQPPQAPANRQPASFNPQAGMPIQLSGDRQAVADARAEIERQMQDLQRQLTLEQMAIERGRHQFIVGNMGTSLNDFLAETGCSVIMPPPGDDSETLTIVGPPERIEEGMNKIMDLASSMSMASADIAKQHANAPRGAQAHARDITRYLQQRQAIEELERMHNARIVPDSTGAWQIYARDGKNAMKARSDVMNLISGHPPTRFHPVEVDPFYHEHLRQQAASNIRQQHGVRVILPEEGDDAPVLLVFEDRTPSPEYQLPRRQPSAQDTQAFQQALQQAQQEILGMISGREQIVNREVEAPVKFHDKIRRHVDRHHSSLPEGSIPAQVMYGGPRQPQQQRRAPAPNVNLRGPQNEVDALMQSLLAFIEQEKQDELERGYTTSFDFPQKFANHLVGRRGENINRLREEFDVDIQINEGKCEVKGPEAKANACKKHILDMAKKLEDEAEHHLNIPPQFHRDLIGHQGTQVNRLQDRYGVRVNFPRSRDAAHDDASEAGENVPARRNNQQPHEVIIKGPSRGADACREELLSLLQYVKDNSFTATVMVAQNQLPSLIGAGGKEMENLRLETGAQIDVPNAREAMSPGGRAEIKIKGSKKAVEEAKRLIEEKAKIFDNTVTRNLEVERRFHRLIIGAQGSNLRNIITQAGGPDDTRLHNRMIRFPKTDAEGNAIRVEGQKPVVDKICGAIEALVQEQESQTTDIAEVKPDKHRLLIGRGGETRRQLEQQFGVTINVPRQTETGPQRSQVRIAGRPENVEKAKSHILDLTKDQEGETVQVPRRLHHSIADNGQFFRRLRNDHRVTVDHAGQRPPPKPSAPTPSRSGAGDAMPLITDDPSANANNHVWELHSLHSSSESGEIPWVLSGPSSDAVAAAQSRLETAIKEAETQDSIGFLILPDPRAYRHVVGPKGSEIMRIREVTGTRIQVPRDQTRGEAIEILGSREGVEGARDVILEVVGNNS
ncbi:uncharacterized protein LTR77_010370 [Saxophila tyrrhenica]|uniref:K Homology domain-containing protein n=1 Tax=Saxophila tyrrhenica TaxID=1690608 RepID=A0AAV9NYH6_9PEZI|nr:hypothetical protein LTR77_010370 [Saxophila tyrrhenica]